MKELYNTDERRKNISNTMKLIQSNRTPEQRKEITNKMIMNTTQRISEQNRLNNIKAINSLINQLAIKEDKHLRATLNGMRKSLMPTPLWEIYYL